MFEKNYADYLLIKSDLIDEAMTLSELGDKYTDLFNKLDCGNTGALQDDLDDISERVKDCCTSIHSLFDELKGLID